MPRVTLPDGCRLAFDEFDFTPPWSEPEPIVLVHGFTKNRRFWFEWIPRVAREFKVVCVDQRGHGDSDPLPAGFDMSLRAFSDDLANFVRKLGFESAHFVMAEFSSAIALDFAVAYPSLIRSLVLPGFVFRPKASAVDWTGWAKLVDEQGAEAWARATNDLRLPQDVDPAKKEWYIRQQGRFASGPLAHFFRWTKEQDLTSLLSRVHVPTLVLTGGQSKQESAASVREAVAKMPRAVLRVFDGMPLNVMSACPEQTMDETLTFLRELRRPDPYAAVRPKR